MRRPRRPGTASLDALVCAAVLFTLAAAGYAAVRAWLDRFLFTQGNAVGAPAL